LTKINLSGAPWSTGTLLVNINTSPKNFSSRANDEGNKFYNVLAPDGEGIFVVIVIVVFEQRCCQLKFNTTSFWENRCMQIKQLHFEGEKLKFYVNKINTLQTEIFKKHVASHVISAINETFLDLYFVNLFKAPLPKKCNNVRKKLSSKIPSSVLDL